MAKAGSGGHGVGVTRPRNVRVDDELWQAALDKAAENGEKVSDVIRRALIEYTGTTGTTGVTGVPGNRAERKDSTE